ncbi:MAG: PKD domain-containing protein, partial [Flavobacteriales bacterium]|nr:PKD domain-containing protein [Flavobacteriales bacterium]
MPVFGQYVVNGHAVQLSCNCYRLTEAVNGQGGSVWNSNMISLNDPFDFTFDVYLGDQPGGADGIAFVLQPLSTAEGTTGGGIGYFGIDPSVAIEVDTYKNNWDPVEDHMAIQVNGDNDHTTINNLAGPEIALVSGANIEDGQTHVMRVSWDPISMTLNAYMDGSLRVSYTGDIVTDYLASDPMVFWGFTGSTGGLNNVHEFCLSIIPGLTASMFDICEGEEVFFDDDSYSALGDVVSWDWDFNNGTTSTDQTPGAITFNEAGTYTVVQTIVDAAGCDASDSLEITVYPNPIADFIPAEVCEGAATEFTDQSSVSSGLISNWDWDFGDGSSDNGNIVSNIYTVAGTYTASLMVTTSNGCVDSTNEEVTVFENPMADTSHEVNSLDVVFNTDLLIGEEAEWIVLDTSYMGNSLNYTFPDSGWYDIALIVTNENGCIDTLEYSIYVEGIPEYEMPNVFTPNGDDLNERFQPFTYGMIEASMKIFNRWGRRVFEYEGDIPPVDVWGWDGTINGG